MKTDVKELDNNKMLVEVEVPTEDVQESVRKAYRKIAGSVTIQGFRKGRIPPRVIDAHVGKGSVMQEALQEMLPVFYGKALQETGLKPIDKPEIEVVQLRDDKPFKFNAKLEVKPKPVLPKYSDLKAGKKKPTVSKEDVDKELEKLQEKFARLEVVKSRPVKKGDYVLMNYEAKIGGNDFEGGSADDFFLEVGANMFPPEFEEKMVGVKPGEIHEIVIDVPDWHHQQETAGQTVSYKVLVKEVKEKVPPKLDDNFAKETSEFDTLKELKADVRKKVRGAKEIEVNNEFRMDVLDELTELAKVEVPETMVTQRVSDRIEDMRQKLEAGGLALEDYMEQAKTTEADLRKEYRAEAEQGVAKRLALEALAEKESLEVTPAEVDNEIKVAAQAEGRNFQGLKKDAEDKGYLYVFEEDALVKKALDFLADKVSKSTSSGKKDTAGTAKKNRKPAPKGAGKPKK